MAGELPLTELVQELTDQVRACATGDLSRGEAMLIAQAQPLDAIFNDLAKRAQLNVGHYPETVERYMRLALKAQSQCRAAVETLALIKNPTPVAFVRQANIAHGPQQVNNRPQPSTDTGSRARESENQPNRLLEQQRNERLDSRARPGTVGTNASLEAVGEVHRTKDGRR